MQTLQANKLAQNPRERAGIISSFMFCFALPILFKGRKKTLQQTDLYCALKAHLADSLGERFMGAWYAEVQGSERKNKKPSIIKVVLRVFGWQIFTSGFILGLLELGTRATQPLLLAGVISEFAQGNGHSIASKLYAAGIITGIVLNVLITHPFMMGMMHLAMKMRVATSSAIYRKALRLSCTVLNDTTTGQIVNLLSNDLSRFDRALIHLHFLWIAPLELIFASYFLYTQIGYSTFFGIGILLLFLPLQTYLGKLISVLRLRTALRTDKRVRLMNEIISGVQVIKMYAWEIPFGKMIQQTRIREMSAIRKVNYIRGILLSFEITLSRIAIFMSLVAFVLMNETLTAEKAFFVTAFYNILRRTVAKFFPQGMSQLAELLVSLKRIETFLMRDETCVCDKSPDMGAGEVTEADEQSNKLKSNIALIKDNTTLKIPTAPTKINADDVLVEINGLKAKWDLNAPESILNDINFSLKSHQLVAIIGPVGCGKSSLIQAILGELQPQSGLVQVHGTFSYASQDAWLFTGTVRDNILFGLPLYRQRYYTVIQKCALERDFELLPQGDKTIVGERGASLSGGQRARISLARAVYRQTDIYLLDDPLSAVDTHVGRHLFDYCMRDFLRHKLVILVTHQLQFVEHADHIIIMDKGKIIAMGTYESMLQSGLDFAQLLAKSNEISDDKHVGGSNALTANEKSISRENSRQSHLSEQMQSVSSAASFAALEKELNAKSKSALQVEESRTQGKTGLGMYQKYFAAGSGFFKFVLIVFLCLGTQTLASGGDYFLSYWVKNNNEADRIIDIYYFTAINAAIIVFAVLRTLLFFSMACQCSTNLHNFMFNGVSRAAMYFFHVNPSGRILNRFSNDLGQIDELLPAVMLDVIQIFLTLFGIISVLCITNPWYLFMTVVLFLSFYYLREFYLNTSRDVKRLEAVARSPMYSHLGASLHGLSTIRALGAQKFLIAEYDNYQDLHSSGYYTFLSTNRAFGYYLDCMCVIYVVIIIINYFINDNNNPGQIGLAITQAMSMTGMVQWGMRQSAELENSMTAVERVIEYKNIQPEGEFESASDKKPSKEWPAKGKIKADNLSMRYFPDPKSEYVLKSLNFEIKSCEKVGIVGRTGAGKSSLINALFRLSYNDGAIIIDDRNTKDIGLYDLRRQISIIPQEPVLFSGTMRYNLDPFEQYNDAKLWAALEEVKLKDIIAELPTGLQSNITEGGSNFSVGQRQLVCLARAILRENRILVMDEATANVDPQTDALIQTTIRNKFKNCTVLIIAHRLHTIMDSDKVLVMDAGQLVEFGSPYELLTKSEINAFYDMVMQTGKASFDYLLNIAKKTYEECIAKVEGTSENKKDL